ncbi:hypothetical protein ACO22_04431 [Paracoccidioides brasiliensis]|uniref:Uncharacterized protein n=1 Tax=Paracoccidioides brasiliensis TaxID=121759 RepID=A0A1D2JD13_PARBR|nr:hypothetical protein ACO22_04431 [Paracoccidioides brasiliensis]
MEWRLRALADRRSKARFLKGKHFKCLRGAEVAEYDSMKRYGRIIVVFSPLNTRLRSFKFISDLWVGTYWDQRYQRRGFSCNKGGSHNTPNQSYRFVPKDLNGNKAGVSAIAT